MTTEDSFFSCLDEQGWACIDGLLPLETLQALSFECQKLWQQGLFHSAQIGKGENKTLRSDIRGDAICWLDSNEMGHPGIQAFLTWAKTLRQQLNQRYFLGLNADEFHFARYPSGTGYQKHIDQHRGTKQRKISLVLYLNEEWEDKAGGELVIYSPEEDNKTLQHILPTFGRLVLFRSDLIPHEVLPCFQTRWSLTGWFRAEVHSVL